MVSLKSSSSNCAWTKSIRTYVWAENAAQLCRTASTNVLASPCTGVMSSDAFAGGSRTSTIDTSIVRNTVEKTAYATDVNRRCTAKNMLLANKFCKNASVGKPT